MDGDPVNVPPVALNIFSKASFGAERQSHADTFEKTLDSVLSR